ncbi:MAG TPA: MG2 domain-containing protein, partial [Tepidisphaeraceae bacterium]|nr:MG2 domain-containing protein [Tepidisphaeraceae bacterium]
MKLIALLALVTFLSGGVYFAMAADPSPAERRDSADSAFKKGNFKDAFSLYQELATSADDEAGKVPHDLTRAIQCLERLGRVDEIDDFREKVIAAHPHNWRLLETAAESYLGGNESFGFIIAGKFYRGNHRGGDGRQVYTIERDRIRALQLMQQALDDVEKDDNKADRGTFYFALADMLMNARYGGGAWQLQYLSDLSKLPDYEDGYPAYMYGGQNNGAPVNADGTPVYHTIPKSWKEAATDGQRWRWCLVQAAEMSPVDASRAQFIFASFLREQFGVQTMAQYGYGGRAFSGPSSDDDTKKNESGPFAVSTLGEDETIARLASGIKRFKLPAEFDFIHIFQTLSDNGKGVYAEDATNALASLFENRQQYDRAAEYWKQSIQKFGDPHSNKKQQLDQIIGNWASFEPMETEPAGNDAVAWLLFRNGKQVSFEAHEIDVPKLLGDIKAYIKSKPAQLDWQSVDVDNVGFRLVEKNELQYIKGKPVAQWSMELKPREKHFDRRVKVTIPVNKAGAYLIIAKMADGNITRIVLWHADTAIVKKTLDNGSYYFVADATTGQPIAKANVEYFGYQQQWTGNGQNYQINLKNFAENTDADGQVKLTKNQADANYRWLITATTDDGRFAYLGFTGIWGGQYYDAAYKQEKVYFITDRPVYRPGDTAKFKFWLGQAQYDQQGTSPFANKAFTVIVNNPKGEKVMEKTFTCDQFGGFDGEFPLPRDATLGQFQCMVQRAPNNFMGGGSFRVEEYKKPEFEVTVDAP